MDHDQCFLLKLELKRVGVGSISMHWSLGKYILLSACRPLEYSSEKTKIQQYPNLSKAFLLICVLSPDSSCISHSVAVKKV